MGQRRILSGNQVAGAIWLVDQGKPTASVLSLVQEHLQPGSRGTFAQRGDVAVSALKLLQALCKKMLEL